MRLLEIGPADRLCIIVPHPDDETLCTGGLLQRARSAGAAIRLVFATRGDKNPWGQALYYRNPIVWTKRSRLRYATMRRTETLLALEKLGLTPNESNITQFLEWHDHDPTRFLLSGNKNALSSIRQSIQEFRPTILAGPSLLDHHPDHSALAVFIRLALHSLPPGHPTPHLISFIVHGRHNAPTELSRSGIALTPEERSAKLKAIECYVSQLVFKPQRFLGFAAEEETFLEESGTLLSSETTPVRRLWVENAYLHLDLRPKARLAFFGWSFGPVKLLLFTVSPQNECRAMTIPIKWRRRRLPLLSWPGRDALGHVEAIPADGGGRISIPLDRLGGAERVFVKLIRRHGYLDEAGWFEAPLIPSGGS